jgi:hypothetical protein
VPLSEIDPGLDGPHRTSSSRRAAAQRKPYKLLLEVMEEAGRRRDRAVRPLRARVDLPRPARGQGLVLETLYLAEDVYSQAEIDEAMDETDVKKPSSTRPPDRRGPLGGASTPTSSRATYRSDLRALLEAKLRGEEIAEPEPTPEPRLRST